MKASNWKRMLSGLMAVLMVLSNMPVMAFASAEDGLCAHHESHVECGYQEAVEGSECTHVCDESCYQTVTICVHEHGDCGYAAAVAGVPCDHVHSDCGYAEAVPGTPCDHVHGDCGYAEAVPGTPCDHVHGDCGYAEAVPGTPCDHVCGEDCAEGCIHTCGDGSCAYTEGTAGSDCTHVCGDGSCAYTEGTAGSDCTHTCSDGTCSYTEGTAGSDCTHVCGDGTCAYSEGTEEVPCTHVCSEESGCITRRLNCQHTHDETCGYVEAQEEQPCDYVCKICYVQPLIDALPGTVTMGNAAEVENALAEIDAFLSTLTDEELAQVDMAKFDAAAQGLASIAAAPAAENNSCGDSMTWTYDAGTLTISGEGYMYDYHEEAAPWASYADEITSVVIGDDIRGIGNHAFRDLTALTSVTFGRDVNWIGDGAFMGCTALEAISLPTYLEEIRGGMFAGCTGLKTVTIGENITVINGGAFDGCENLTTVNIPEGVTVINGGTFSNCSSLTSITLPEGITAIGEAAFINCGALEQINIPDTVTEIGALAFCGCSSLTEITLPEGLTKLETSLFNGCEKLASVNIPSTVTELGDFVFLSCYALKNVTIPQGVESIGEGAFNQMGIESIVIPDSVTYMGPSQFYGCENLTSVTIGSGLTEIPANAFTLCGNLTQITVPGTVETIGDAAFADSALEAITFLGDVPTIAEDAFQGVTAEVTTPEDNETWTEDAMQNYGGTLTWNGQAQEPSKVVIQRTEATDLVLSGSSARVYIYTNNEAVNFQWYRADPGSDEFVPVDQSLLFQSYTETMTAENSGLRIFCRIADSDGRTVDSEIFTFTVLAEDLSGECGSGLHWSLDSSSGKLTISGSGRMDDYVYGTSPSPWFAYRNAIHSVEIESGVTYIGELSFIQSNALTSVSIPESVTAMGNFAFTQCFNLSDIRLPSGITAIPNGLLESCANLRSLEIPAGVTSIGSTALFGTDLTSLTIPEKVTSIGQMALAYASLTNVVFEGSAPEIDSTAFSNVTATVSYPDDGTWDDVAGQNYGGTLTWEAVAALPGGSCGDSMTWTYDAGTLTISGEGYMYDYHEEAAPWAEYAGQITSVVIGDDIRGIGNHAFRDLAALTSVTFGRDVNWIGDGAFMGCTALETITLPTYLEEIRGGMFAGCTKLQSVTVPENVTAISGGAFDGCKSLTTVNIPSGVTVINGGTFAGCESLQSITLPESVTAIGEAAFVGCSALNRINIPSGVKEIGAMAFHGCTALTEIELPEGLTKLETSLFNGCEKLASVNIPSTVTELGDFVFLSCNALKNVTIPEGVTTIGEGAFNQMGIESVVIPNSVTTMGESQFFGCQNLKSVTIGTGLTEIPANAFTLCENLTTVNFSGFVSTIGPAAFADCTGLTLMFLPYGLKNIESNAFAGCTGITDLVFGGSAPDAIAEDAFAGVTANASYLGTDDTWAIFPKENYGGTITWIADYPTSGQCGDGDVMWQYNAATKTLTISGNGGMYDFDTMEVPWKHYNDQIEKIVIAEGITAIGDETFPGCNAVKEVTVASSVKIIGGGAFSGCVNLSKVTLNEGLTTIRDFAFEKCYKLTALELPSTVKTLGGHVFAGSGLTEIVLPSSLTKIASGLLLDCGSLTSVNIPDTVTEIGSFAFSYCAALNSITIPASVSTIGASAFANSGLTNVKFLGNMPAIDDTAFTGVTATVRYPFQNTTWNTANQYGGQLTYQMTIPLAIQGTNAWTDVLEGDTAYVAVYAMGQGLTYEWFYANAGSDNFIKTESFKDMEYSVAMTAARNGRRVYCVITDAEGNSITSDTFTLTMVTGTDSGESGEGVTWAFDASTATLTISGKGAMADYTDDTQRPWHGYRNAIKHIQVDDGVTHIGSRAFNVFNYLVDISLPDSVTSMGIYALAHGGLKSFTVPAGLREIPGFLLEGCANITSLVIPDTVTAIGDGAFFSCNGLTEIRLSNSLTAIPDGMLYYCPNLKTLTIPAGVTSIGSRAISQCHDGIEYITFTGSAPAIAADAFEYTRTTVRYPANDATWTDAVMQNYGGELNWEGMQQLKITAQPESVTVPEGTMAVTVVEVQGDGLTYQWYYKNAGAENFLKTTAFTGNYYQVEMTPGRSNRQVYCVITDQYGNSVTTDIATLRLGSACGETLTWSYDSITKVLNISGSGYMYDYHEVTAPWASYAEEITSVVIDNGVRGIGNAAFRGCTKLTDVSFGRDVSWIGDGAFDGCTALQSVTLPEGLREIRSFMFAGCTSLKTVILPENATSLGMGAFTRCSALTAVNIPAGITVLNGGTFDGCSSLESIDLPEGLTTIGEAAFANCTSLTDINIPSGVTEIGELTFWGCSSLTEIVLPEGLTKVPASIFNGCTNLSSVTIPSTVIEIGSHAFLFCNNLKSITLPAGVTTIGEAAFNQMGIESVVIPNSVTTMGESQFYGCQNLKSVTIGTGLTELTANAFTLCENLTEITVPANVKTIGAAVFADTGLEKIIFEGGAPSIVENAFQNVTATVSYPAEDTSWTDEVRQNYGGNLTWNGKYDLKIIRQPESVAAANGATAKVTFEAQGDGLTYTWYFKDTAHTKFYKTTSFTGPSYQIQMNSTRAGRQVYCVVTDKYGNSVTTDTVTLNMASGVKIVQQPVSTEEEEGVNAIVTVRAEGDGLTYQWYFKDTTHTKFYLTTSFKGASYTVQMNESRNGRQVYCVITDQYGNTVTTDTVTLTMSVPKTELKITKQPVSVTVVSGATAKVTLTAQGDGLTYAWYFKNAGAKTFSLTTSFTGNSYSVKMDASRDGRQIYCIVTDQYGDSVQSNTVTLNMATALKITQQPKSVEGAEGEKVITSVRAQGDGLTYSWYYKDKGATKFTYTKSFKGASYSVEMNEARDGRQVYCIITDQYGNTVTTDIATLTMSAPKTELKITKQPVSVTAASGTTVKITLTAQGDGLTYKWYFKNAGAKNFSLTTSFTGNSYSVKMDASRDGRQVYCVVTDQYGDSVQSNTVTLTMAASLKITQQPKSVEAAAGVKAITTVKAEGDGLTYSWYFKDKGAADFSYTKSFRGASYSVEMNEARDGRQVYCVITDQYGNTVTTDIATLTMSTAGTELKITKQPVSVSVAEGTTAKVTFTAQGDGLTYKWYFKNANASTFSLTTTFTGNSYSAKMDASRNGRQVYCVVTDQYGNTVTTDTVTISMS